MQMNSHQCFSLIIPTYNRARFLDVTLNQLAAIDYPVAHFEVIIVNNNSSDNSETVIQKFIKQKKMTNLSYIFETSQGRSHAMNKGIRAAKFSKIISLDDDLIFPPTLLKKYQELWSKYPEAAMIGGPVDIKAPTEQHFKLPENYKWMLGYLSMGNKIKKLKFPDMLFAANLSFDLNKIKGKEIFSTSLGIHSRYGYLYAEDMEFCWRLLLNGKKILYSPNLKLINIVENERLNIFYVISRIKRAGKERKIIDDLFKIRFKTYKPYSFTSQILSSNLNFYDLIAEFFFLLGYKL